jgi:large subunit ribosomal protein L18
VPRLVVYRSNRHMYAQLVDDLNNKVIMGSSDLQEAVKEEVEKDSTKTDKSKIIGKVIATRALKEGFSRVVFDRNGFKYHGRVKAIADAVREAGVEC